MANNNDLNFSAQQLAVQLETLRKGLYKLVDDTILNIARTCAGISPDAFNDVVASIFTPHIHSSNEFMAGAAPVMATHRPSPRTAEKQITEPRRRGRPAVWENSSDKSLRRAHRKRVLAGKAIEPELESELAKRFPGYDAETHKFTGKQPRIHRAIKQTDWTQSSNDTLRKVYKKRIENNKPIEPELESELVKRFTTYDAATHTFTGREFKTDWTKSSDISLRQTYANRIKASKPIEPELEAELIKRFPTYDATTHKFTGRGRKVENIATPVAAPVVAPQFDNDIIALTHLSSPQNKSGKYPLMFDGETVLLRGGDTPYELVLFDKKTKVAVVRKEFDDRRYKLFIVKCKKGKILEDMRTGARDIRYIPETHQLMAREMPEGIKRFMVYTPNKATEMWTVVPDGAISISAQKMLKETIVIEEDGRVTTYPLINLSGMEQALQKTKTESAPKQKRTVRKPKMTSAPVAKPKQETPVAEPKVDTPAPVIEPETIAPVEPVVEHVPDVKPTPAPVAEPTPIVQPVIIQKPAHIAPTESKPASVTKPKPDLVVTTRMTKMTLGAKFYDVFVNGKRILQNHIDTEITLFLDGTVLGVHGRVTDIDNMPDIPSWQVFDTNLKRRDFSYVNTFSKKSVFIKDVKQLNETQILLYVSNKMQVILDKKNVQQVFRIASEKTK